MRVCFKCGNIVMKDDNYMRFTEFNKCNEIKSDYCHKHCWDDFLTKIGSVTEAKGMLQGLKGYLTKMGILPPEEVIVG